MIKDRKKFVYSCLGIALICEFLNVMTVNSMIFTNGYIILVIIYILNIKRIFDWMWEIPTDLNVDKIKDLSIKVAEFANDKVSMKKEDIDLLSKAINEKYENVDYGTYAHSIGGYKIILGFELHFYIIIIKREFTDEEIYKRKISLDPDMTMKHIDEVIKEKGFFR